MAISKAQLVANRANAQKSSGPRTPEGKHRSSLNSFRHGVTGQVVTMPEPQMAAYLDYHKEQFCAYAPANPIEKQLVQTIIDTQWRLNSGRAYELSLFASNHEDFGHMVQAERPDVHAAFTAVQTLSSKANELRLLSLYEQRLNRTLHTSMKQIHDMQAERKQRERLEMQEASLIARMLEMQGETYVPADDGFVFSPKTFVRFQSREQRVKDAKVAERVGYDIEKFLAATAKTSSHPPNTNSHSTH